MPITSIPTNDRQERFVATTGQTVFPYDFPIYAATDLLVTRVRGITLTTFANGTDYTVSGVDNQSGGNVTLTAAAQAGDIITITSAMPTARAAQFVNGGDLPAAALEAEFNKLRILIQQSNTFLNKALLYPASDQAAPPLPIAALRASKALAFDAQGAPIAETFAALSHAHAIADVTGLQIALDGKAATSHTQAASSISDSTLAGRALLTAVDVPAQRTALSINNVNNTSDADKPISTATQNSLNTKKDRGTIFDSGLYALSGNYTLDNTYKGRWVQLMGSGQSLTIPSGSIFTNAEFCYLTTGANGATIIQGAGVTLRKAGSTATGNYSVSPWSIIQIFKNGNSEEYVLIPVVGTLDDLIVKSVSDSKGNVRDLPVTNRTAAYTAALSDTGGIIRITTGGVTIPSGVFSAGQAFSIANNSASNQTITQGAGVTMYLAGTGTTGNRTLAQRGLVVVSCMAPNEFFISGPGLT